MPRVETMPPKFGTSGLRGLVVDLTPTLVEQYIEAFLQTCLIGTGLYVGRDLRPSSPEIANMVIAAGLARGVDVVDCGEVPTPALALASMAAGAAAVIVTGGHIPADRIGLKFYLPHGEISEEDEIKILRGLGGGDPFECRARRLIALDCVPGWIARYVNAFGSNALAGMKISVWSNSAVSRDMLLETFIELGADVIEVGRSDESILVDTEAVSDWAREKILGWCSEHRLGALVSTQGDGDRPLLADATGRVIPADILGQITAAVLGAKHVATPVTSNSGVEISDRFKNVARSRIGSPYVIATMAELGGEVVGYEANGGFILGFDANIGNSTISALAPRDSLLPLIATLSLAATRGGVAEVVSAEPGRYTSAENLENIEIERSQALIRAFPSDTVKIDQFLVKLGEDFESSDLVDGLRIRLRSGRIFQIRPSCNAPELHVYVEAERPEIANAVRRSALSLLRHELSA